ncbi:MAG: glycoside hydrolase family protein [Lentisphaeria bacterium]
MENYRIWGSSIIHGKDGRFYMFASRVPKFLRFHPGWMIASEIVRASSDTPEGPYVFEEVVLPARGAQYWDGRSTHNPKIVQCNGKYVLFYMGSTHPFEEVTPETADLLDIHSKWCIVARANKRIGIAISDSVFGPWERFDEPILKTKPNTFYSFFTSNPSPVIDENGKVYLIFKSRCYHQNSYGRMMIGLATAPDVRGPYSVINTEPLFSNEKFGEIEDPHIWKDCHGFHMLAKDQYGTITKTVRGNGILAHSEDCLHWHLDKEPLAYSKNIEWTDGKKRCIGSMERVSTLQDSKGDITHLSFAVWEGSKGFSIESANTEAWNMVIPIQHTEKKELLLNILKFSTKNRSEMRV